LHPATWISQHPSNSSTGIFGTNYNDNNHLNQNRHLLWTSLIPQERMFCRPALGDDGQMSPELLELWTRNCAPVLSQPFRYELVNSVEATKEGNEVNKDEEKEEEQEEEDVERARHDQDPIDRDDGDDNILPLPDEVVDDVDPVFDTDGNNGIPFDDEDERLQIHDDHENLLESGSTFFSCCRKCCIFVQGLFCV
jgi:hypothetical protein